MKDDFATLSFRDFFLKWDGLHNLKYDLAYSIMPRYHCDIGCQMCFLKDHWLTDINPGPDTPEYRSYLRDVFSHFQTIACLDDLRLVPRSFMEEMAPMMEFHTSDNGLYSQMPFMKDLPFRAIGQLSFSSSFLNKVPDITPLLTDLHAKTQILRMNFIHDGYDFPDTVLRWADEHTQVWHHGDVKDNVMIDSPTLYEIIPGNLVEKCGIITEVTHLRYRDWYADLTESMFGSPYHSGFDPTALLSDLLREKSRLYARYATKASGRLKEYFSHIADNLIVNDDYTFVPRPLLDNGTFLKNWIETPAGWWKGGEVRSIMEWKS